MDPETVVGLQNPEHLHFRRGQRWRHLEHRSEQRYLGIGERFSRLAHKHKDDGATSGSQTTQTQVYVLTSLTVERPSVG